MFHYTHLLTFRKRVDAELDVREVSAADLATYLVEADAAAHGELSHHLLILTHVQIELLQRGEAAWLGPLVVRADVGAVLPAPSRITLRTHG